MCRSKQWRSNDETENEDDNIQRDLIYKDPF